MTKQDSKAVAGSMRDLLIETHKDLERLGPGSEEMTLKALGFLDNLDELSQTLDFGCGTGAQSFVLARHIKGSITGIDVSASFIDVFNKKAKEDGFADRVTGVVGSMENIALSPQSFDLIWSEGAIDSMGFEKGIGYWNGFLREGGFIAVTCPSWLTDEQPVEVEQFWAEAGSSLNSVAHNIASLQNSGYAFTAAFALPEECWTHNYFAPREAKVKKLLEKYVGNALMRDFAKIMQYEVELYSQYKQHYGYVFYIGKKSKGV